MPALNARRALRSSGMHTGLGCSTVVALGCTNVVLGRSNGAALERTDAVVLGCNDAAAALGCTKAATKIARRTMILLLVDPWAPMIMLLLSTPIKLATQSKFLEEEQRQLC
jgi:hypothetical protein